MKTCTVCNKTKDISDFWKNGKYYRGECKECKLVINRPYKKLDYIKHREKRRLTLNTYAANNKEKVKKAKTKYYTARLRNDPAFKLIQNLRSRIYKALKGKRVWGVHPLS